MSLLSVPLVLLSFLLKEKKVLQYRIQMAANGRIKETSCDFNLATLCTWKSIPGQMCSKMIPLHYLKWGSFAIYCLCNVRCAKMICK